MYYQPKPIRSNRLILGIQSPAQLLLKKIGRWLGIIILILATAELFALLEQVGGTKPLVQTPESNQAQLADSYLQ